MERLENSKNIARTRIQQIEKNQSLQIPAIEISLAKSTSFKDRIKASLLKQAVKVKKEDVQFGKLVLMGTNGVGKTSIVNHFVSNTFTEMYQPTSSLKIYEASSTIECKKLKKKHLTITESIRRVSMLRSNSVKLPKEKNEIAGVQRTLSFGNAAVKVDVQKENAKYLKEFHFELVDTPGNLQEQSPIEFRSIISEGSGFLLICSYDNPESVDCLEQIYNDIKSIRQNKTVPISIVINKTDLINDGNEEIGDRMTELASHSMLQFSEVSIMKKEGFKTLIENVTREMNLYNQDEEENEKLCQDYEQDFWG